MKVWNADISASEIVQKDIDIDIDLALNDFIDELYDAALSYYMKIRFQTQIQNLPLNIYVDQIEEQS